MRPTVEPLEPREVPSALRSVHHVLLRHAIPAVITPALLRALYDAPPSFDGAGQTIAIVDPYPTPLLAESVAAFDSLYGLPPCNLTVDNSDGGIETDPGWAEETCIDVEWAHVMAPAAHIVVFQAYNQDVRILIDRIFDAAGISVAQPGQQASPPPAAVSLSFGGGEVPFTVQVFANQFAQAAAGTVLCNASGDDGGKFGPSFPTTYPFVLGVGGTELLHGREVAAPFSGGGRSRVYPHRPTPDVAAVAAILPFVDLADGGLMAGEGTSFACPIVAGIIADVDAADGIHLVGDGWLGAAVAGHALRPVTHGGSLAFPTHRGYNLATGRGSFDVARLAQVLG